MPNYNKVILAGHLTKAPDIKTVKDGLTVGNCGIAVNRKYKDKSETMFIDFTIFGKSAEALGTYATKGSAVLIEGRLDLQQWESEGQKKSRHVIIVENFQLLGGKSDSFDGEMVKQEDLVIHENGMIKDEDVPF